ncbi:MAG: phosphatase PAP2 family protein [Rhodospirillaceae bacterium]
MMAARELRLWRVLAAVGLSLIIFPGIDLFVSRQFFLPEFTDPALKFMLSGTSVAEAEHWIIRYGSLALAAVLVGTFLYSAIRRCRLGGVESRRLLFLVLALVIGPGLVTNLLLKETWSRARPSQIQEFGGPLKFSPALVMSNQCEHNCSFVSGDASIGFFLHSFAYVARRRQREIFFGGLATGLLIGLCRIAEGAHFLSDILYAGAFMVAASAAVHALMYGRSATLAWWREHILPA